MRLTVAALVLLAVVGCGDDKDKKAEPDVTPSIQGVQLYTGLSHAHLKKGEYPHTYPQSPPVGGAHSPVWLACGIYHEQLPLENAVHSMEHGAIWLTYAPTYPNDGLVVKLADLNPEYVMVSPYEKQDSPVVATTWGMQLKVDSGDDPRLVQFIQTYAGGDQGGEKGAGCAKGGVSPEKAREFDATQK